MAVTTFVGQRSALFRLAFVTAVLTVATLGFYRFWMKTRLRRWYWSAVRPGGTSLEYVGEPLEKLLGFLIAVVFLAFYLGLVNLVLVFGSFALLNGIGGGYALYFLGVVPLIFYARYRARRYVLGRTRWRGIRFGVRPGAWGYAARALGHWLLTLATLGLWWPRMTFALERYRIDRTSYGDLDMVQGGGWRMLYPPFGPLLAGALLSALTGLAAIEQSAQTGAAPILWLLAATVPLTLYGLVHYSVHATRLLVSARRAGPLGLIARPRVPRVLGIYALGGLATLAGIVALMIATGAVLVGLTIAVSGSTGPLEGLTEGGEGPVWLLTALGVLSYFLIFLGFGILRHIFILMPLWRHYAQTLTITGMAALPRVQQTRRDQMTQAEGFAEALDVGAAL